MHQKMLQEKEQGQNDEEAKDDTKNGQRRTPAAKKDQPAKNNSAAKTPINEDSAGSDVSIQLSYLPFFCHYLLEDIILTYLCCLGWFGRSWKREQQTHQGKIHRRDHPKGLTVEEALQRSSQGR